MTFLTNIERLESTGDVMDYLVAQALKDEKRRWLRKTKKERVKIIQNLNKNNNLNSNK